MQVIPQGLTPEKLDNYALNFFGYGKWEAPIWLIGLEEWGAATETEFENRFGAWIKLQSCGSLLDINEYASECKIQMKWGNQTWRHMHAICCEAGFEIGGLCQSNNNWGGSSGENINSSVALIEAMPFPNRNTNENRWAYANWNQFGIQTRDMCADKYLDKRLKTIFKKISDKKPKLVVLYGASYGRHLQAINIRQRWIDLTIQFSSIIKNNWEATFIPLNEKSRSHCRLLKIPWARGETSLLVCISHPSSWRGKGVIKKVVGQQLGQIIYKNLQNAEANVHL